MKSVLKRVVAGGLLSSALALGPGAASAVVINGVANDVIDYSFSSVQGGVTLSGTVNVDVTEFNTATNTVTLFVTLANTTSAGTPGNNRWTHWGFGSSPNLVSIGFSDTDDGGMEGASISNFPVLSLLEACSTSNSNCAGGGGGGILEENSDFFTLTLGYGATTIANGISLDPFGVKFQAVGAAGGAAEFYTCAANCSPPPCGPDCRSNGVPEPTPLALVGLSLALVTLVRRRRRS